MNLKVCQDVKFKLTMIVLLGMLMRLAGAARAGIWYDEAVSVALATGSLETIYQGFISSLDNSPPFFNIFLHFWIFLFGSHPQFTVELPSVIAGVLTIIVVYRAGNLFFSEQTGLIAALLLALSPFHIKYSQEIRPYAWAALFVLLSFYYLFNYLELNKRTSRLGYFITTLLALYTHNLVILPLLAQAVWLIYYLIKRKLSLLDFCILTLPIIAFYLPWLIVLFQQVSSVSASYWVGPLTWQKVFRFIERISFNDGIKSRIFTVVALIPYLVVFARSFISERRIARNLLYGYLFLPPILLIIISIVLRPLFINRYLFFVLPAYILLLSEGLASFVNTRYRTILLSLMILISLVSLGFDYRFPSSPHSKYLESFMNDHYQPGDAFIHFDIMTYVGSSYYAADGKPILIYRSGNSGSLLIPDDEHYENLSQLKEYSRLWVIEPFGKTPDWRRLLNVTEDCITEFKLPKMRKGRQIKAIYLIEQSS